MKITIDFTKINKDKIVERKYTNKDGVEVTQKLYSMDVIDVKEPKVVKEGDTWKMIKTHFVAESQTKEEREQQIKTPILGDGLVFEKKEEAKA